MDEQRARLAISLVDLTNLNDGCDPLAIDELCARAERFGTATVCVWPDFVAQSSRRLAGTGVGVATVVNFPTGDERPFSVGVLTERVLADGATEVDVVLPYRSLLADALERPADVLQTVRSITDGHALMKVILETGELHDVAEIESAARFAIENGTDFVKTSTGKSPVSATIAAAEAMLRVIAAAGRPVGIKPSGGISTAEDAELYLAAAEAAMGEGWLSPATFRFGASGLLTALIEAAGLTDDESAAPQPTGY